MPDMNLGKRIEKRLGELGWERNDLLRRVPGLTAQSLSALITRDSRRSEHDVAIANVLGVSLVWLVSGQGEKTAIDSRTGEKQADDIINIPLSSITKDPHLACILPVHKGFSIHRQWVSVILPEMSETSDLAVMPVSGYSMAPTFGAGDLLLVDQAVNAIGEDGVYVLSHGSTPRVRRIQARPDGSVVVISDNQQYEPMIVPPENIDTIVIYGRVLYAWTGRRL